MNAKKIILCNLYNKNNIKTIASKIKELRRENANIRFL